MRNEARRKMKKEKVEKEQREEEEEGKIRRRGGRENEMKGIKSKANEIGTEEMTLSKNERK